MFSLLDLDTQSQRIAFLSERNSTIVQVLLLIKLESFSRIEFMKASGLLVSENS